jgi:hypothetical protein
MGKKKKITFPRKKKKKKNMVGSKEGRKWGSLLAGDGMHI